ncbi:MAG TPA: hypothetical protein VGO40_05610 [Longimicrobium sp.]|jgi:hypothetical protein|nr:hypothetical protein [Longimicrobium sp.]
MSVKFRNVLLAAAATMVSLTAGCTDGGTPVSPGAGASPASPRASATAIAQLARFREKPISVTGWAKAWIGPWGGRLDFVGFSVIVPPGAVSRVTMFTIKLPADVQGGDHVVAEFGPHNMAFAKPVTIGFPYRGTTLEDDPNGTVVWWNNGWVPMGGTVSADSSQILTETPHFSEYGTTSSRGGVITASGG